jgi:large-conductance mechanosensitive channel
MILEVLYNHPLPIGAIIACVIGLLIGVGLFVGNTILIQKELVKKLAAVVFYLLSFAIIAVAIYSLVKALS